MRQVVDLRDTIQFHLTRDACERRAREKCSSLVQAIQIRGRWFCIDMQLECVVKHRREEGGQLQSKNQKPLSNPPFHSQPLADVRLLAVRRYVVLLSDNADDDDLNLPRKVQERLDRRRSGQQPRLTRDASTTQISI